MTAVSLILFLIFLFLSAIHFYWGFGGKWGKNVVIPTSAENSKVFSPGLLLTFIVAFGLLIVGAFILVKAKFLNVSIPYFLDKSGLWIIAFLFIARAIGEFKYLGFFKKIRSTKFGQNDTKYYSPLCMVIAGLTIILALRG
jgi:glucan phosphoethanolaminetransferase (alkaline phosphatase superfamily)